MSRKIQAGGSTGNPFCSFFCLSRHKIGLQLLPFYAWVALLLCIIDGKKMGVDTPFGGP